MTFEPGPESRQLPPDVAALLDSWDHLMEGRVEALLEQIEAWPEARQQIYRRWVAEIEESSEAGSVLGALFPQDLSQTG